MLTAGRVLSHRDRLNCFGFTDADATKDRDEFHVLLPKPAAFVKRKVEALGRTGMQNIHRATDMAALCSTAFVASQGAGDQIWQIALVD